MAVLARIFIVLLLSVTALYAQPFSHHKVKYWLPETVVNDIVSQHTLASALKHSIPLEAIVFFKDGVFIQTRFGKFTKVAFKELNGKKVISRLPLNNKYYKAGAYDNAKFVLSKEKDNKILLEIIENDRIDSLYYISRFGTYSFEQPYKTYNILLLKGEYDVAVDGVKCDLTITSDGRTKGHPSWTSYTVTAINHPAQKDTSHLYSLINFTAGGLKEKYPFAFRYDETTKTWLGYSYRTTKGHGMIRSDQPVVTLKRQNP